MISLDSDSERVLLIPMDSIFPGFSEIPAVSAMVRGMPSKLMNSLMISLVVPGYSLTIARSSFIRAFTRVDFPTFGFPMILHLIPAM